MKAVKGNKEYNIDESQKKAYQDMGYDIFDSSGKLLDYGRGKTVPYGDYMKLKEELETVKAEKKKEVQPDVKNEAERTKKAGE